MADESKLIPIRTEHRVFSLTPLFPLGQLLATNGALNKLASWAVDPLLLLGPLVGRHVRGDWGEIDDDDWNSNTLALVHGARLLSVYRVLRPGSAWTVKLWIITEADRKSTTILLPEEY